MPAPARTACKTVHMLIGDPSDGCDLVTADGPIVVVPAPLRKQRRDFDQGLATGYGRQIL